MISRDGDRSIWTVNRFDSGIGGMSPPAFYSVALGGSAADFCVACLDELIVKFISGQDFAGDLGLCLRFYVYRGSWLPW